MNLNKHSREIQDAPALTEIRYRLVLKSSEPPEKLAELHELCV